MIGIIAFEPGINYHLCFLLESLESHNSPFSQPSPQPVSGDVSLCNSPPDVPPPKEMVCGSIPLSQTWMCLERDPSSARNLLALKPALGTCQCYNWSSSRPGRGPWGKPSQRMDKAQPTALVALEKITWAQLSHFLLLFSTFKAQSSDLSFPPWFISPSCSWDCSLGWVWAVEPQAAPWHCCLFIQVMVGLCLLLTLLCSLSQRKSARKQEPG